MHFLNTVSFLSIFVVSALFPLSASACEGPCITNTTDKYIEKFTTPVKTLLGYTNIKIASRFYIPSTADCASHLQDAYHKVAYASLENAIFPSYFHGKCEQHTANGTLVNPPGCPNPDCPVVCGTPGSMVHFFPVLRNITVTTHEEIFALLTKQDSASFQDVKTCVLNAMPAKKCPNKDASHTTRSFSRLFAARFPRSLARGSFTGLSRRETCFDDATFEKDLHDVLQAGMVQMWPDVCDAHNEYAKCNWEKEMKAFILQFP
ncbi:hypothetical protein J3R30DRAFT_47702 [Lentinula aciculospora]|uniref:Uncharacterized protein n=1 Tax=Lentinula aciculospora TaxID=153920 RepID=A0A9W9ATI5_9AGAR|nr:hypothetical protein J3R30DRAFT_47702 [Lentinula aciculospora]